MKIERITAVRPKIQFSDKNNEAVGVFYSAALMEFSGQNLPVEIAGIKINGEWFTKASGSEGATLERMFKTGDFL